MPPLCTRCGKACTGNVHQPMGSDRMRYIRHANERGTRYTFAVTVQRPGRRRLAPALCWGCVFHLFTASQPQEATAHVG